MWPCSSSLRCCEWHSSNHYHHIWGDEQCEWCGVEDYNARLQVSVLHTEYYSNTSYMLVLYLHCNNRDVYCPIPGITIILRLVFFWWEHLKTYLAASGAKNLLDWLSQCCIAMGYILFLFNIFQASLAFIFYPTFGRWKKVFESTLPLS